MRTWNAPVLLVTICSLGVAQSTTPSKYRTNDLYNGRYWQAMSSNAKMGYLMAFWNGLLVGLSYQGDHQLISQTFAGYATPDDTLNKDFINAIDDFYFDNSRLQIPIPFACKIVRMKFDGRPPSEIDREIERLKKQPPNLQPQSF